MDTHTRSEIHTISAASFQERVLDHHGPVAVEFMSYGCGHCRVLEPVIESVAQSLKATESVFRVNVALDEELASRYGIDGTPTLVMFRDSIEVGRSVGPEPTREALMTAMAGPFRS